MTKLMKHRKKTRIDGYFDKTEEYPIDWICGWHKRDEFVKEKKHLSAMVEIRALKEAIRLSENKGYERVDITVFYNEVCPSVKIGEKRKNKQIYLPGIK